MRGLTLLECWITPLVRFTFAHHYYFHGPCARATDYDGMQDADIAEPWEFDGNAKDLTIVNGRAICDRCSKPLLEPVPSQS